MSKSFPEYTGKVRSGHAKADADLEDILNQPFDDKLKMRPETVLLLKYWRKVSQTQVSR